MLRRVLKYVSLTAMLIALVWLATTPGWEPAVTFVVTLGAFLGADFGIREEGRPQAVAKIPSGAGEVLSANKAIEKFVRAELKRSPSGLDLLGYSVHALLDGVQPLVRRSLAAGKKVRILLLSPDCAGLREKSALEHEHQAPNLAGLRERNRQHIEKTYKGLSDLGKNLLYQEHLGKVLLEVRLYNQFPIYRGVQSENGGAVVGGYLLDPSKPGRELDHTFFAVGSRAAAGECNELNAFANWCEYLWRDRSRPAAFDCIVFDLYDTLILIPPTHRDAVRVEMSKLAGIPVKELDKFWEMTRDESNRGAIPSTQDRFNRILELAGRSLDSELAARLADLEHQLLREHACFCEGASETLQALRDQGYRLAILSNCSASVFSAIAKTNVSSRVDLLRLSFEMQRLKPDPKVYKDVVEALGSYPTRSVFVGDGANDEFAGARKAGLTTVLVGSARAGDPQGDHAIRDLYALPEFLRRLGQATFITDA